MSKRTRAPSKITTAKPGTWDEVENEGLSVGDDVKIVENKASKKYPSPKKENKVFTARWNEFIGDVSERENFKVGHLNQLRILCQLYVEYELLMAAIEVHGYVMTVEGGRNGPQRKRMPEVDQLNRTRLDILAYSKTLGLLLVKDKNFVDESEKVESWK